jgi:hypothetical protein
VITIEAGCQRWAHCAHDGRMHALEPADVILAPSRGYAEALCGQRLPADVATEDRPSGALCLPCVVGVASDLPDPPEPGTGGRDGWSI